MRTYYVSVDIPFIVTVQAKDEDDATEKGDALVAEAYEIAERALSDHAVGLGFRYDDTEVECA